MDDELQEPLKKTRLVAWLTAGLLAAGLLSVGVVKADNEAAERRVVAAGQAADGVEVPPPPPDVVPDVPPPSIPPSTAATVAPTTTAPPAPKPTTPPTTQPPRTTTTKTPVPATTATTSTTRPAASATVNVVNEYSQAVNVKLNGRAFTLAPGAQSGPVTIPRFDHGNDTVEVSLVSTPTCGMGDAGGYFSNGGSYRVAIIAGTSTCQPGVAGPDLRVTPA